MMIKIVCLFKRKKGITREGFRNYYENKHAAALVDELSAKGGKFVFFVADVGEEDQVNALVDHAISTYGQLDGAFNNAGVEENGKPIVELTVEDWVRVNRINVQGVFHCIKHQFKAMKNGGSIVNTSSGLGVIATGNCAEYVASKHAVCGLTRATAVEGAPLGIRVNAVLPGIVQAQYT